MLSVYVDNVQDVAVVQVEGRIVQSDAAYTLRNAVTLQTNARAASCSIRPDSCGKGWSAPA